MRESVEHSVADPGAQDTGAQSRDRVAQKLRGYVLEFCRLRLFDTFTMSELNQFVGERISGLAPDSAGRILRMLRAETLVDYAVVNRAKSTYTIRSVN